MKPYYSDDLVTIYHGEALSILPELPEFDAIVTDPPYSSGGLHRSDRMQSAVSKYSTCAALWSWAWQDECKLLREAVVAR